MDLIKGHANKIIADHLSISVRTVETYRAILLDKIGIRTFPELVRLLGWKQERTPRAKR